MKVKNILLLYLPFIASAVMLTVIQPPVSWAPLAWVSLVPFVLVCSPSAKPKQLAIAAYLVSLCYWLGNLYWIGFVTIAGWIAFCIYMGLYWPGLALCIRYCRMKKIPLSLAVPVLFVGAEALQGYLLTGFSWRFLAHSQYENIKIIQIADIFGAAGISFLIAMVNGIIAELITAVSKKNILKTSNFLKTGAVCAAVIATIAYGNWRIIQSDEFTEPGPLVASVQSNVPQVVKESGQDADVIFNDLLTDSYASAEASAEFIVWPETMVMATLDERFLLLCSSSHPASIFDKTLGKVSKETSVFILVGAHGGRPEIREDGMIYLAERYNSAFLYRPDGNQDNKQYNKIHLVPFGEFVPFRQSVRPLYKLLMKLTPYDYEYSLDRGTEYTAFEIKRSQLYQKNTKPHANNSQEVQTQKSIPQKKCETEAPQDEPQENYKFSVMICYEDTTPSIARNATVDKKGQKRIDWLVNISNDGWFVRFKEGKVLPSTELAQHAAICVFRAVENRLSILRSVNTGISCLIDSTGQIHGGFVAGTLPVKAMERKGLGGWLVDRISVDSRITFFSKYGQWLDFCCGTLFVTIIIIPLLARFIRVQQDVNSVSVSRP